MRLLFVFHHKDSPPRKPRNCLVLMDRMRFRVFMKVTTWPRHSVFHSFLPSLKISSTKRLTFFGVCAETYSRCLSTPTDEEGAAARIYSKLSSLQTREYISESS